MAVTASETLEVAPAGEGCIEFITQLKVKIGVKGTG
jgi:hypothetical protein